MNIFDLSTCVYLVCVRNGEKVVGGLDGEKVVDILYGSSLRGE